MATSPVLHTHALTIGYPAKPPKIIASQLDLTLTAGELVCLIGPNGAGKSTLLQTLSGMRKALSGDILIRGDALHTLSAIELAQRLSVVLTEQPNVGLMNGYSIVALGRHPHTNWTGKLTAHDEAVIRWAVDAVGADDFAAQPLTQMSDGQRQKIMIARALAQEPAVMLLDEPTAYLDLPRRVDLMRLLRQLTRETQRAILLSTHDLDLAMRTADRLWLMGADGALHVGAPEDLILNGTFEAVFASEGVHFDTATGAFRLNHSTTRPTITLYAASDTDRLRIQWTQRALERAGYLIEKLTTAPTPPPVDSIEVLATGWRWHHPQKYPAKYTDFSALHPLLEALKR